VDRRAPSDCIPWNHSLTGFLTLTECLLRGRNKSLNKIRVNLGLYKVNLVNFNALYEGKIHKFESLAGI
jgi:hypothetical protein